MGELKHKLLDHVKNDLADIETELKKNLTPHVDLVRDVAGHILFSGGKRLRPLLVVLSARICGYTGNKDKRFSTAVEYLHAATLLHDDLVDGARFRRGSPAAYSVWDTSTAALVGDYLLARTLSIGAETGKMKIIRVMADITENMSQGEILQLMKKGNPDLSEAEYMEIIRCKTAVLIQGACQTGALIADAGEHEETALSDYGFHLGMAFQMADDLLDYTADSETLGKEIGADLKEGKLTLPVIRALKAAKPGDRSEIERIIRNRDVSAEAFQWLTEMLEKYRGIQYTKETAAKHVEEAKDAISIFGPSETGSLLLKLADYSLNRNM